MDHTKFIFDIPIYWCKEDMFYAAYKLKLSKHLQAFEGQTGYSLTDDLRNRLTERFWQSYIAPWKFNQIVGWIRICISGNQLRGELWYMNAKRAGRQVVKKQFSNQGKAFEMFISSRNTSEQIYRELHDELIRIEHWKGRKIILDLETFDNLFPYVDWRKLIDKEQNA